MENGKEPAFPISGFAVGVTKREYFAGLVVQGMASQGNFNNVMRVEDTIKRALIVADALLAELDGGNT